MSNKIEEMYGFVGHRDYINGLIDDSVNIKKKFILYKIYDDKGIIYLGRTKQKLQDRLRGHFFKKPMQREIDIDVVTKIEHAEFNSEADMFLYEIYFINLLKPILNKDDKARDELTVKLPEVEFKVFDCGIMKKWKLEINKRDIEYQLHKEKEVMREIKIRELKKLRHEKEITEDKYWILLDESNKEIVRI